jgi:hypothetical protein
VTSVQGKAATVCLDRLANRVAALGDWSSNRRSSNAGRVRPPTRYPPRDIHRATDRRFSTLTGPSSIIRLMLFPLVVLSNFVRSRGNIYQRKYQDQQQSAECLLRVLSEQAPVQVVIQCREEERNSYEGDDCPPLIESKRAASFFKKPTLVLTASSDPKRTFKAGSPTRRFSTDRRSSPQAATQGRLNLVPP